jgi:hypothetical protein
MMWSISKWRTTKLLHRLKCEFQVKTMEEQGVGARSLVRNTSGVKGRDGTMGWDYEEWQAINHSHGYAQTKQQVG